VRISHCDILSPSSDSRPTNTDGPVRNSACRRSQEPSSRLTSHAAVRARGQVARPTRCPGTRDPGHRRGRRFLHLHRGYVRSISGRPAESPGKVQRAAHCCPLGSDPARTPEFPRRPSRPGSGFRDLAAFALLILGYRPITGGGKLEQGGAQHRPSGHARISDLATDPRPWRGRCLCLPMPPHSAIRALPAFRGCLSRSIRTRHMG
jgi:hypothetical protein